MNDTGIGVLKTTGAAALLRFGPYPAHKDSGVEWLGKSRWLGAGAEEFITTEKPGKPLHRITDVGVRSIHTDSAA